MCVFSLLPSFRFSASHHSFHSSYTVYNTMVSSPSLLSLLDATKHLNTCLTLKLEDSYGTAGTLCRYFSQFGDKTGRHHGTWRKNATICSIKDKPALPDCPSIKVLNFQRSLAPGFTRESPLLLSQHLFKVVPASTEVLSILHTDQCFTLDVVTTKSSAE